MKKVAMAVAMAVVGARGGEFPEISGVYPHLAMTNAEGECGTGAVVPWAGSLWVITYGPHCPVGSTDKLYRIGEDLRRETRPESVGGTPANRLVHKESGQLLIGPYLVDSAGKVRLVPVGSMPGRLTGAARHLSDPAGKVYVTTMEEALYELDMGTMETRVLIKDGHNAGAFEEYYRRTGAAKPKGWAEAKDSELFGYHGKGTCSGFGKVFYANNGQFSEEAMRDPRTPSGSLAWWKEGMADWELIRTNQFTEVTTRDGVLGNMRPGENAVWALGWDARSVILAVTADGENWTDYRLPKGSHSYDGAHGWNTEWPRIREIGEGEDLLATMHGTFWKFPAGFAPGRAAGLRPRSTYLKVIGDFCRWGERVVFGCDDHAKSEFLNVRALKGKRPVARASESNLWFVEPGRLDRLGPREGRGAVWANDRVKAGEKSDAYLFAGYGRRWLWVAAEGGVRFEVQFDRDGSGKWETWKTVGAGGHSLAGAPEAEWVRLAALGESAGTWAVFHYGSDGVRDAEGAFGAAAPAGAGEAFENDAEPPAGLVTADAASVICVDGGKRWRLPRRAAGVAATCGRICREVSTERDLLHAGELFYELPADNAGGIRFVRPVAATAMRVDDYDTWRGLLVLRSGEELRAGVADDLWRLGKPVGVGGPWKDTEVKAGEASDPYLLSGFDRKTALVRTGGDAAVTLEVDIDGMGKWVEAVRVECRGGEEVRHEFPRDFAGYWIRARCDRGGVATVQFLYE